MARIKQFPMPDVGEGLTEAEILTWHVAPGDTVTVNQIFVEIETAKAAVELPCPYAGVVRELFAAPGATVQVGSPLIAIDLDPSGAAPATGGSGGSGPPESSPAAPAGTGKIGEEVPGGRIATLVGYGPRAGAVTRRPRKGAPSPAGPSLADPSLVDPSLVDPSLVDPSLVDPVPAERVPADRVPADPRPAVAQELVPQAKPPVRKLARELGIDLRTVLGSGTGGVITREDVQRAAQPVDNGADPGAGRERRERREPIRGVRKATAAAVVASAFTAPHVTEFITVDVTPMMELRARIKQQPPFRDVKLTPLAFAARALCLAVRRTPEANARWDEAAGEIVYFDYVHLGIAAATPRGLVVPKIRDADRMSLREVAVALDGLTATAREGRTLPGDMIGGTITITNVGIYGVDTGTPILYPGESAILALGAIRDMPWVVDGAVVPRKVCQLALSFDHRVLDGQQGSQFLAAVAAVFADPALAITY